MTEGSSPSSCRLRSTPPPPPPPGILLSCSVVVKRRRRRRPYASKVATDCALACRGRWQSSGMVPASFLNITLWALVDDGWPLNGALPTYTQTLRRKWGGGEGSCSRIRQLDLVVRIFQEQQPADSCCSRGHPAIYFIPSVVGLETGVESAPKDSQGLRRGGWGGGVTELKAVGFERLMLAIVSQWARSRTQRKVSFRSWHREWTNCLGCPVLSR